MKYYELNGKWFCCNCGRDFKTIQATTSHIYRAHVIPGQSTGGGHIVGTPAWNKGLSKETDIRVKKYAATQKGKPGTFNGRTHTISSRKKISAARSINNKGGRCKWFEVAGQKVQGTWERNMAMKFEELHIQWEKLKTNRHTFEYEMDGKTRCYTPDFYLPTTDIYIELKGRWWGRDREKMDLVLEKYKDRKIVVVEKDDYERFLRGELVW